MKRLLYVVNDAGFFLSHRARLAAAARDAGYDVHVATPAGPLVAKICAEGFTFHPIPMVRSGMHPLRELRTLWALGGLYRRLGPDLVHHVTIKPVLYGGIAARMARVPAIVSAITGLGHVFVAKGLRARVLKRLVKIGYRSAFRHPNIAVVFQNPDDRADFLRENIVQSQCAVLIKGSGVDMSEFAPRAVQAAGSPLVICASRMLHSKGVGDFVAAAKRLLQAGRKARFALVGDSDPANPKSISRAELAQWATEAGIEWWGRRDDMADVMAQADIVCLPTTYGEGVPKVLIEAAAAGRAIVATDVPGCREIVRHEENGLLVPPRDISALAAAMERLIADPALRARMGARGREIAVAEFSLEHVIRETLAVYRRLGV